MSFFYFIGKRKGQDDRGELFCDYEEQAREELQRWLRKMEKSESLGSKFAKRMQKKLNQLISEKVQQMFTKSMKKMVQAALVGSEYTTKVKKLEGLTLEEQERMVFKTIENYRKIGAIVGAAANYHFLDVLGEVAMNGYRLRMFKNF